MNSTGYAYNSKYGAKYVVDIRKPGELPSTYYFDSEYYVDEDNTENIFGYLRRLNNIYFGDPKYAGITVFVNGVEIFNTIDGLLLDEQWLKNELVFNLKKC
jgi:hypothetical protein